MERLKLLQRVAEEDSSLIIPEDMARDRMRPLYVP